MRKVFLCLAFLILSYTGLQAEEGKSAPAHEENSPAQDSAADNSAMAKLERGAVNTATCWAEIPAGIYRVSEEDEPVKGVVLGTIAGAFGAAVRVFTGIFDMLTFFAPPYNKPPMQPEYAMEHLSS